MKKAKEAWRKNYVVRIETETEKDYEWWRHTDKEPAEGFVENTYRYSVPAYPRPEIPSTRQPRMASMSRRKLRKRLYYAGYRGEKLKAAFAEIVAYHLGTANFIGGVRYAFGWCEQDIRERLGNRGWKVLTKGVSSMYLIFDEMGSLFGPDFFEFASKCSTRFRKYGAPTVDDTHLAVAIGK